MMFVVVLLLLLPTTNRRIIILDFGWLVTVAERRNRFIHSPVRHHVIIIPLSPSLVRHFAFWWFLIEVVNSLDFVRRYSSLVLHVGLLLNDRRQQGHFLLRTLNPKVRHQQKNLSKFEKQ